MELMEILDEIEDPIEVVIVAMGFIAIKMVLGPIEMIMGDSMT